MAHTFLMDLRRTLLCVSPILYKYWRKWEVRDHRNDAPGKKHLNQNLRTNVKSKYCTANEPITMTDDCTLACPVSTVHVSSIQKANVVAISLPLGSFLFCLGQWLKCACRKQNSMDGSKFQDTFFIRFIRWKFGWSAVALKLWLDH